jgi:hypothetical protein
MVSGGAALALSSDPTMSFDELRDLTMAMAEPIDDLPGNAPYSGELGSGRLYLPFAFPEDVASVDLGTLDSSRFTVQATPNPVTDRVEFRWADAAGLVTGQAGAVELRVYDSEGRQVHEARVRSDHYAWNVRGAATSDVASGVYFIRLRSERDPQTQLVGRFTIVR